MAILSEYYQTEIAAFDVATTRMDCYGQNKGYKQRVYLVYDGLHYDAFGLNYVPDGPEDFDTTIFSPHDDFVRCNALAVVQKLKEQHLFTDTATFRLVCGNCQAGTFSSSMLVLRHMQIKWSVARVLAVLVGEKGATEHAMITGHTNFSEYK